MSGIVASHFNRFRSAARRAVAALGFGFSVREQRRIKVAALATFGLVGQLVLGPFAQALPCDGEMASCDDCPHMTTDQHADGHPEDSVASFKHGFEASYSTPPAPPQSPDCPMHLAGVCSGVNAAANASSAGPPALPLTAALETPELPLPPLDGPPSELLRPPKQ
jgi:hypothetical protein